MNGFPFALVGTKYVKTEFGIDCYAVHGIDYSISSVNEFVGMTENYPKGFQIMFLGR